MNKRGQAEVWQLTLIFEILVALVIAAFFIMSALTYNQHTKFDKYYLEEDMKLMINSIQSSPSFIQFNYSHARLYNINIKEDDVEVIKDLKYSSLGKKRHLILKKTTPLGPIKVERHE